MERRPYFLGGTLVLAAVASFAVGFLVMTSFAQTNNCTYTYSPNSLAMTVTAGSSSTAKLTVKAAGTGCSTDSMKVQLWDTPSQTTWPSWCTPTETPLTSVFDNFKLRSTYSIHEGNDGI